jgi:hypothetical protein
LPACESGQPHTGGALSRLRKCSPMSGKCSIGAHPAACARNRQPSAA